MFDIVCTFMTKVLPMQIRRLSISLLLLLLGSILAAQAADPAGTRWPGPLRDTGVVPSASMQRLRALGARSNAGSSFYITETGKEGFFEEDPADHHTPDDSAMTLVTAAGERFKRVTGNGTVDARWFGAIPNDGKDDQPAIQRALDFCAAHSSGYGTVHLDVGVFTLGAPLLMYRWVGTAYAFQGTNLEGESSFWPASGSGTVLQCKFKDKFAIGVQLGKGNRITRIKISGQFHPPYKDAMHFYNSTFEEFRDSTCRDTNYSPFAGIVIDPFSNSVHQVPDDGGYPGYREWYRGNGSLSGSTGIEIEDVSIEGFVVGVCSSPNSFTRNAELTNIDKIQFSNTKLCISGSQDQEKGNIVTNLGCWGITHTIFATGLYGAHTPGNWTIENANIAGSVNRLIYNPQAGYFGSHFRNIFAESLGRLGTIYSNQGTIFESSEIGFAYYATDDHQYLFPQLDCSGVTFIGCDLRMYGTFKPITISGSPNFIGCGFETVPFADYSSGSYPTFTLCTIGDLKTELGVSGTREMYQPAAWQSFAYGNYSVAYWIAKLNIDNPQPAIAYPLHSADVVTTIRTTQNSGGFRSATVTINPDETGRVRKGDVICTSPDDKTQGIIGTVSAVNALQVTIDYIPAWMEEGQSFHLSVFLPMLNMTFLGDLKAGSTIITNVVVDMGDLNRFIQLGGLMRCSKFSNEKGDPAYQQSMFRIVAFDPAARTVTLDQPAARTMQGVFFANGDAVKDLHSERSGPGFSYLDKNGATTILQEGGHLYIRDPASGRTLTYRVKRSGYYNAAHNDDPRQAAWQRESVLDTIYKRNDSVLYQKDGVEYLAFRENISSAAADAAVALTDAAPPVAAAVGDGAGQGARVVVTGTEGSGIITVTGGASAAPNGVICTIGLPGTSAGSGFSSIVLSPNDSTAADCRVYATKDGAHRFTLHLSGNGLAAHVIYQWTYLLTR
jgi:hypothetical protein